MSKNHFLLQCWEFSRQDLQVIHFDDDADGIEDDVDDDYCARVQLIESAAA